MYLKSVSLKGFKSFPDRTRLEFSPGVSVVVGPNGCGKSNITDAVLWALGEQSPLAVRGQSMQDVIFAGGEGQGRRRYAEVEVVIDNSEGRAETEFSEISIRRRLERSGDGTYWLNGARCRLVDVVEVLSDTNLGREMHSVISQGRVEEIVHSKPRDRRLLIEEAAGLGKHRKRRRRAQLKLDRTRENLDRALDVEREARSLLRPLKRQAEAAEHHARLEGQELELRALLVADELRSQSERLRDAERKASTARKARDAIQAKLEDVHGRRAEAEERFAARDRERTLAWAALSRLRGSQERLTVRLEALSGRESELEARLDAHRQLLLPVADLGAGGAVEDELDAVEAALGTSAAALSDARSASSDPDRAAALGRLREGVRRAAEGTARAERMVAGDGRGALERRIAATAALLESVRRLRDAGTEAAEAVRGRVASLDRRVGSEEGMGEDVAGELQALSREEWGLQSELRSGSDSLTECEVEATQLRDRHAEVAAELGEIAAKLGTELVPAAEPLPAERQEDVERKLERLARRREQIGPVNPLAEGEYADARAHVDELESQREDVETALAELEGLIDETDRKIHDAFEDTFDATARNFEELVGHLFPGGRGRLRRVEQPGPRKVIGGGGEPDEESAAWPEGDGEAEDAADHGVEIEVTPAGKATKRLSLLSGGEKSLVAIAFVFAVMLARPCPFYILDEVEAALDDANIDRFLQLVRRCCDRSQFVIVTHQKRTMDAADVLYGVSMGRDGITKVVSRRLPRDADGPVGRELSAEAA
jgi:chromosome segregation ATPase